MAQTTVSVINKKGGVGKTMLADELSFALEREGWKVAFTSVDPQAGARHGSQVVADDADFVVIDTRGSLDGFTRQVVSLSDVVVVPFLPSEVNVASTEETISFVHDENPSAKVFLVLNRFNRSKKRTSGEFWKRIEDGRLGEGETCFFVPDRAAFQNAEGTGESVHNLDWRCSLPIEALAKALVAMHRGGSWKEVVLLAAASNWTISREAADGR